MNLLQMIWFIGLVLTAIGSAAYGWCQLDDSRNESPEGISLWPGVVFVSMLFAVAIQHDVLVEGVMWWWMAVLPEPNSGLNVVTAGLLTFGVWMGLLVAVCAVGACLAEGWKHWRARRFARSAAMAVLDRASR